MFRWLRRWFAPRYEPEQIQRFIEVTERRMYTVDLVLKAFAENRVTTSAADAPPAALPTPEHASVFLHEPAELLSIRRLVHLGELEEAGARAGAGEPHPGLVLAVLGDVLPLLDFHRIAFPPGTQVSEGMPFFTLVTPGELDDLAPKLAAFDATRVKDPFKMVTLVDATEVAATTTSLAALARTGRAAAIFYG